MTLPLLRHALFPTLLLGAIAALSGCNQGELQAPVDQGVRPARLFQVSQDAGSRRHEFVGRVEAAQTVDLSFEVGGRLNELTVREGQTVERGSLVAALDPVDYQLRVREAEVQVQLAQQDYERKRSLLQTRAVAQSAVDDARSLLELRRVNLQQARQALAYTRISAPFEAYVARRFTDNHVLINPSQPVVRLLDLSELWVTVSIPQAMLATVDPARVISIEAHFEFAPEIGFPLELRENTGESDAVAQTYEVSFAMQPADDWNILPGMTATVETRLRSADEFVVNVPGSALVTAADGNFQVWVYDAATGNVSRRPVAAGTPTEAGVPITNGLIGGELIVATGASFLQDGMQVRPLNERELAASQQ